MFAKVFLVASAAVAASAHYTFPGLIVGGKSTGDWQQVRRTVNYQTNSPVENVNSAAIRCYQLDATAPGVANVTAGDAVGFTAAPNVYHPGPLAIYMAKAPAGTSAQDFQGDGKVWFKIYQDQPTFGQQLTWPSNGKSQFTAKIPACIPAGDYLIRVEHIGLHVAQSRGAAQFYISCGQLRVSGGGSKQPSDLVAFPGAYTDTDPGILININYPVPTSYKNPGPDVFTC